MVALHDQEREPRTTADQTNRLRIYVYKQTKRSLCVLRRRSKRYASYVTTLPYQQLPLFIHPVEITAPMSSERGQNTNQMTDFLSDEDIALVLQGKY